jgi:excisionase family DNA binding protein
MKLLRIVEAAGATGLSQATWRSWILQGKVSVVRLGRSVRISEEEISRLIRKGTTPARGQ